MRLFYAILFTPICTLFVAGQALAQNGNASTVPPRTLRMTLEEAIGRALGVGEEVSIAQAGVRSAEGNERVATSGFLPQVSLTAGYTRTLQSQYSGITSGSSSNSGSSSDTSKGSGGGTSFLSNLPFGKANQWSIGLQATQNIFTGGRLTAQRDAALARTHLAAIDLTAAQAQLVLNVTQSYYDAVLANELVRISQDALNEADVVYKQTELAYKVGEKAEFDALRAKVSRDNQVPVLIQNENARDLAYWRLKQLLNVSLDDSLQLVTPISDSLTRFAEQGDTAAVDRSSVVQATENVRISQDQVRIAESQRWPQISVNTRYAPVAYPSGVFPSFSDWHTDWTVGVNLAVPIFTGGSISGNVEEAKAGVDQATGRLEQTREAAELDARSALNDLESSQANLRATASTVAEARRAYQIAEIRFHQGISTQVELDDSRLQEEQARANYARALRNYQVARAKIALIRDLPLNPAQASVPSSTAQSAVTQQAASTPTTFTSPSGPSTGATATSPTPTGSPTGGQ